MKGNSRLTILAGSLFAFSSLAQVEFVRDEKPQALFSGPARQVCVTIRNSGTDAIETSLRFKLSQVAGAVAATVSEAEWKKVAILPNQTVIECGQVSFPDVRSVTQFVLQWFKDDQRLLGRTDVMVYPADLLQELKSLIGKQVVGVVDPQGKLKPLLKLHKIEFEDLERGELEQVTGRLIIAGPFTRSDQMPARLGPRLRKLAARGTAAIWIQPPLRVPDGAPSWYCVRDAGRPIIVAQDKVISNLEDSPLAQLALISMVGAALNQKDFQLPETTN